MTVCWRARPVHELAVSQALIAQLESIVQRHEASAGTVAAGTTPERTSGRNANQASSA